MTRRRWEAREIETLRALWPYMTAAELEPILGHSAGSIHRIAAKIGFRVKHPEYLARMRALSIRQATTNEKLLAHRFTKGHVPATKGKPMPPAVRAKVAPTMFKKGQRPQTWKPIGSLRINSDGYLDRKVQDTGYPPRDWVGVHRLIWEEKPLLNFEWVFCGADRVKGGPRGMRPGAAHP
jgi:hypothetical protein